MIVGFPTNYRTPTSVHMELLYLLRLLATLRRCSRMEPSSHWWTIWQKLRWSYFANPDQLICWKRWWQTPLAPLKGSVHSFCKLVYGQRAPAVTFSGPNLPVLTRSPMKDSNILPRVRHFVWRSMSNSLPSNAWHATVITGWIPIALNPKLVMKHIPYYTWMFCSSRSMGGLISSAESNIYCQYTPAIWDFMLLKLTVQF